MAGSRFVLSAQVMLQRPTQANLTAVTNDIRRALDKGTVGITKQVDVKVNSQQLRQSIALIAQLNKQLQQTVTINQNIKNSGANLTAPFGSIPGITTSIYGLVNVLSIVKAFLKEAAEKAVEFNDSMIKVSQITKQSFTDNRALAQSLYAIAEANGVDVTELGKLQVKLSSTGMSAKEVQENITTLAKLSNGANFTSFDASLKETILLFQSFHASSDEIKRDLEINAALANKLGVSETELASSFKSVAASAKENGLTYKDYALEVAHASVQNGESIQRNALAFKALFGFLKAANIKEILHSSFNIDTRDSAGNAKKLTDVILEISKATQGLSGTPLEEKLVGAFGRKFGPSLLAFVGEYNEKLKEKSIADRAAGIIDDENSRRLETLSSKYQTLKTSTSELFDVIGNDSAWNTFIKGATDAASSLAHFIAVQAGLVEGPTAEAYAAFGHASAQTIFGVPKEKVAKLVAEQKAKEKAEAAKQAAAAKDQLNTPLSFANGDQINSIGIATSKLKASAQATQDRIFARNTTSLDVNNFQTRDSFNAHKFEDQIPQIALQSKVFGANVLPSFVTGEFRKELQRTLSDSKGLSTADTVKNLRATSSPFLAGFAGQDNQLRADISKAVEERNIASDARLSADRARETFGIHPFETNAAAIGGDIQRSNARVLTLNGQLNNRDLTDQQRKELSLQWTEEVNHIKRLTQALNLLATSTGTLQKQFEHTARERQRLQPQLSLNETLAFGSPNQRFQIQQAVTNAEKLGANPRFANQLSHDQLTAAHDILKDFGNSQSHLFSGKTGSQVIGEIIKQQGFGDTNLKLSNEETRLELAKETLHIEQEKAQLEEQLLELWKETIAGSNVAHKATGGYISSGPAGKDRVPAMLTRGEYVIKKAAVERIGVGTLQRLNGGGEIHNPLNKYADGGAVDFEALGRAAKEREDAQAARNAELRAANTAAKKEQDNSQYESNVAARTLASQNNTAAIIAQRGANQNAAAIVAQNRAASTPTGLSPSEQFRLGRYGYAPPTKNLPQFETFNGQGSIFGQSPFAGYKLPVERVANNRIVEERQPRDTGASVANTFQPYKNQDVRQLAAHRGLSVDTSGLVSATQKLSEVITSLNGLSLDAKFSGSLEVVVNGGAVLQDLGPKFEELARAQVEKGITELIEKKFPNVGGMNYKQRGNDAQQKGQ